MVSSFDSRFNDPYQLVRDLGLIKKNKQKNPCNFSVDENLVRSLMGVSDLLQIPSDANKVQKSINTQV